jgi:hypothetical protein
MAFRCKHPVGKYTVVRQNQKAFRVPIQTSCRENAPPSPALRQQIHHGPCLLVTGSREYAGRLVHHQHKVPLYFKKRTIQPNSTAFRVNLRFRAENRFPVDRNAPGANQFSHFAPGAKVLQGKYFIEPFQLHAAPPFFRADLICQYPNNVFIIFQNSAKFKWIPEKSRGISFSR